MRLHRLICLDGRFDLHNQRDQLASVLYLFTISMKDGSFSDYKEDNMRWVDWLSRMQGGDYDDDNDEKYISTGTTISFVFSIR